MKYIVLFWIFFGPLCYLASFFTGSTEDNT
jgi:hypothetical protein